MLKQFACALSAVILAGSASAHDFWLLPKSFTAKPDEPVAMRFMVGHADDLMNWPMAWSRIVSFADHGPEGFVDLLSSMQPQTAGAEVSLNAPGSHLLTFTSGQAESTLDADKFNDYLEKEGLAAIMAARAGAGTTADAGHEFYSRRAKAIIQIGDIATDNVTVPVGHTLEIVPLQNPMALQANEDLTVQVMFRGVPLEGATIDLESVTIGNGPLETMVTDSDGKASFRFPKTGSWKLNVIWGVPMDARDMSAFETTFSSLTFGYS